MVSKFLNGRFLGLFFVIFSLIYIVIGFIVPPQRDFPLFSLLKTASGISDDLTGQGFAEGAVYPTTDRSIVPLPIKMFGSWLRSDRSTGIAHSPWYQVDGSFWLMIAGYPNLSGNSLIVEVKNREGKLSFINLEGFNPGEKWDMREVFIKNSETPGQVRIVATDGNSGYCGWLGVSQPFIVKGNIAFSFLAIVRIFLSVLACIVLIIGPGVALRATLGRDHGLWSNFTLIALPGIIFSALSGLIVWSLASLFNPQIIMTIITLPVLLWFLLLASRKPVSDLVSSIERKALTIFMVVVVIAMAKGTYSQGPIGELYGGTISRTLEVGDRSDSRISFHVVQMVAHGTNPYSKLGSSIKFR